MYKVRHTIARLSDAVEHSRALLRPGPAQTAPAARQRPLSQRLRSLVLPRSVLPALGFVLLLTTGVDSANAQNIDALTDLSSGYNDTLAQSGTASILYEANSYLILHEQNGRAAPAWSPDPLKSGGAYLFFVADAPFTWNSNPALLSTGAQPSWRFDPKLQLDTAFQTNMVQASLQVTGDLDRYLSEPDADTNGIQSLAKLSLKCAYDSTAAACVPEDALWAKHITPYLLYQSTLKYDADYSMLEANQNDLGVGITFDSAGLGTCSLDAVPRCPTPTTTVYPYLNYGLDIQVTRRYSNVGADSESIVVKPSVTDNFSKAFAVSVQPSFRVRRFDELASISRQDETLIVPAVVAWDPPIDFLMAFHPEIRISANFSRTWSNVSIKAYKQWDVGPLIELIAVPIPAT